MYEYNHVSSIKLTNTLLRMQGAILIEEKMGDGFGLTSDCLLHGNSQLTIPDNLVSVACYVADYFKG